MAGVPVWNIKRILLASAPSALVEDCRSTVRQGVALLQLVEVTQVRFFFPSSFFFYIDRKICHCVAQAARKKKGKKQRQNYRYGTRHKQAYTLGVFQSFTHFSRTQSYSIAAVLLRLVSAMLLGIWKTSREKIKRTSSSWPVFSRLNQVVTRLLYMAELPATRLIFFYPQTH